MTITNLLPIIFCIPFLGAICICTFAQQKKSNIYKVSIWTSMFAFLITAYILISFEHNSCASVVFAKLKFSLNPVSNFMLLLTTISFFIATLLVKNELQKHVKKINIILFLMEAALIAMFTTENLYVFYIMLETAVILAFIIMGLLNSSTSVRFFSLFSICSAFLLFSFCYITDIAGTDEITALSHTPFNIKQELVIFCTSFLGFAASFLMLPLQALHDKNEKHSFVFLKIIISVVIFSAGAYGIWNILMDVLKKSIPLISPYIFYIAIANMIYAMIAVLTDTNFQKVISRISMCYASFIILGLFSQDAYGITGAILTTITHGLITSSFFTFSYLVDKYLHIDACQIKSIYKQMPILSIIILIPICSTISLPLFPCFSGKFLIINALFKEMTMFYMFIVLIFAISSVVFIKIFINMFINDQNVNKKEIELSDLLCIMPSICAIIIVCIFQNNVIDAIYMCVKGRI